MKLVPRLVDQGYSADDVAARRRWVETHTGCRLEHVGRHSIPTDEMRGNIENPIGAVQVPVGVAGPLEIRGEHARGTFYVPLATTEGALVRSYERGMVTITRAGGAEVCLWDDENRVAPVFFLDGVRAARDFARQVDEHVDELRRAAESTTGHGRLVRVTCRPIGREVIVDFAYTTGDAQGMNMIVKATDAACRWIREHLGAPYSIFSGHSSEKRASGALLAGGKGKRLTAGVHLPSALVNAVLRVSPRALADTWRHTVLGHLQANAVGYNAHFANGLTALFIACGQDVANVANAAVGITHCELDEDGIYASVTLPSLTVATVGGGTRLGTSHECLGMLGCTGSGRAARLAEIAAATLLAGELSMLAAIASGEFVQAHERYGRNRPPADAEPAPWPPLAAVPTPVRERS